MWFATWKRASRIWQMRECEFHLPNTVFFSKQLIPRGTKPNLGRYLEISIHWIFYFLSLDFVLNHNLSNLKLHRDGEFIFELWFGNLPWSAQIHAGAKACPQVIKNSQTKSSSTHSNSMNVCKIVPAQLHQTATWETWKDNSRSAMLAA